MTEILKEDINILAGDCRVVLRGLAEASFDAVVTDPPYELGFMGKKWDSSGIAYDPLVWGEVWRVLKPGGHLLAFGGSRTYHRLACAIEDAGFEVRDMIEWIYGSGFPKSLDVSKAIDKARGAKRNRNVVPKKRSTLYGDSPWMNDPNHRFESKEAISKEAKQWDGWGTALKPAHEPICVARKPLMGSVVANVLQHGTGAINIDGCRIGGGERRKMPGDAGRPKSESIGAFAGCESYETNAGRWPANLILDGEAAALLDVQSGQRDVGSNRKVKCRETPNYKNKVFGRGLGGIVSESNQYNDAGGVSRFFYTAKSSGADRGNEVKGALPLFGVGEEEWRNSHPTVKPLALMRYLLKLVCPPGARVLDPFLGSGSTAVACREMGFGCTGIELLPEHVAICRKRIFNE